MICYRFTDDIPIERINHNFHGHGVFGRGTYFSLDDRRRHNIHCNKFTVFCKYSVDASGFPTLTESHLHGLSDGGDLVVTKAGQKILGISEGTSFDCTKLISKLKKLGHAGVVLKKAKSLEPEGGEQLILFDKLPLKLLNYSLAFLSRLDRDQAYTGAGTRQSVANHYDIVGIPSDSALELSNAGIEVDAGRIRRSDMAIAVEVLAAIYQGREVKLDQPYRSPKGSSKKFHVYVKDGDKVIKVSFGDPDMEIRRDNKKARNNFRSRHNCDSKKDKTSPGYWSCKMWEDDTSVTEVLNP